MPKSFLRAHKKKKRDNIFNIMVINIIYCMKTRVVTILGWFISFITCYDKSTLTFIYVLIIMRKIAHNYRQLASLKAMRKRTQHV